MGIEVKIGPIENKEIIKDLKSVDGRYGSFIALDNLLNILNKDVERENKKYYREGDFIYLRQPGKWERGLVVARIYQK